MPIDVKSRRSTRLSLILLACLLLPLSVIGRELTPYSDTGSMDFALPDQKGKIHSLPCLLYTSDAADDYFWV